MDSTSTADSNREPSNREPSNTEPSNREPSNTEPSNTEPSNTEASNTEPLNTGPLNTKRSNTEPSNTEPSNTEPSNTEPSNTEPSSTKPSNADPVFNGRTKRCKVYTRTEWGALSPRWTQPLPLPVRKVVISRTNTPPCLTAEQCKLQVRKIQASHMLEDITTDIKYHFLVGGDGALYEGRGYWALGPQYPNSPKGLQNLSGNSIDIAFIETVEDETAEEMLTAVYDCISIGMMGRFIAKIYDLYWVANDEIQHVENSLGDLDLESNDRRLAK